MLFISGTVFAQRIIWNIHDNVSSGTNIWWRVVYSEELNLFATVGRDGTNIITSPDGINWTS